MEHFGPVPMFLLVRVRGAGPAPIAGVTVMARMGDIWAVRASSQKIDALARDPNVISIASSRPGGRAEGGPEIAEIHADAVQAPPTGERGDRCLVAVIETGIDVLHGAFADGAGGTRLLYVWDQGDPTGPAPSLVDAARFPLFTTGTLHTRDKLNEYRTTGNLPPGLLGRDRASGHGTHVTSIAAGRAFGTTGNGVAPDAPIVVVIPQLSSGDAASSLGYSVPHVQALHFISEVADAQGLPVAVNVSAGMNAGAHDGTSLLESAFDTFTDNGRLPGRVIVKSAGNEQQKKGHAVMEPIVGTASIDWDSPRREVNKARDEDYLEAWYDAALDLQFRLVHPEGHTSPAVSRSNPDVTCTLGQNSCWMHLTPYHGDNGDSCLQISIERGTADAVAPLNWTLQATADAILGTPRVDVWVERHSENELGISFGDGCVQGATLTIPGTARSVICVGAYFKDNAGHATLMEVSSHGLTRDSREKPDLVAPGKDIEAACAGTASSSTKKVGTSMAAPHVTGALALILSSCAKAGKPLPNANQLRSLLVHTCLGFTGWHHPGLGFGRLDVEAALKALG